MAKQLKVCFDRLLPRDVMRFQPTRRSRGRTRAISPKGKAWVNGSTLRVRFMGGTAAQQRIAREQAAWWTEVANLKITVDNAPNAEFRIAFDANDGAWSYVGTDCRGIPLNEPTMNLGFLDGGTAAHEFGHAIGLAHEHQNPAGVFSGTKRSSSVNWQSLPTSGTSRRPVTMCCSATRRTRSTAPYSTPSRSCCTSSPPSGP